MILDIILVIAFVVILFVWNPFGIFGGGLKLTPTTNMVTEVREIGQLVTSEYYGEVIASIEESRMDRFEEEEISVKASSLFDNLYEAAVDLHAYQSQPVGVREAEYKLTAPVEGWKRIIRHNVTRRNIVEKLNYHQFLEDLTVDILYEDLLKYIWKQKNSTKQWNANNRQKEEALFIIYSDVEQTKDPSLDEAAFTDFFYQNKASELNKKETKKKLAMVGRGWVKAGFDFSTIDNSTFYMNQEAGEIHFFGLAAVILNADINPWFIPEKGIPGFEILDFNGKVDFRDAKKVKQYCMEKLILNAHRADILENAELHGAETLKTLFSLMTGKEIEKVFFHNDKIIKLAQEIAEDEYVNYHEASLLDSQLIQERTIIDSLRKTRENSFKNQQLANHREENISVVLARLRQLPFQDLPGTFSYFSKTIFEIAKDSLLDISERDQLKTMRLKWDSIPTLKQDVEHKIEKNIWFTNSLSFVKEYNWAIEYLLEYGVVAGSVADSTLLKSNFTPTFLEENWVQNYSFTDSDSVMVTLVKEEKEPKKILLDLLYPFQYNETSWDKFISQENLWLDSLPAGQEKITDFNDSTVWVYESKPYVRVRRLNISLYNLMSPHLLEEFADKDNIWISDSLSFIRTETSWETLEGQQEPLLTSRQSVEMEAYYQLLVKSNGDQKNKGPVVQANEWVQKKFENNKSVREWLSEIKNKMIE